MFSSPISSQSSSSAKRSSSSEHQRKSDAQEFPINALHQSDQGSWQDKGEQIYSFPPACHLIDMLNLLRN